MTQPKEIVIDDVVYRPIATIPAPSPVKIVILQRGWVMVGRWSQDGEMCRLDNAQVIRVWGTTKGLGQLVRGPVGGNTQLDPTGVVTFHILTVVAAIDCEEAKWASVLDS